MIITNSTTMITKIMIVLPLSRSPTSRAVEEAETVKDYSKQQHKGTNSLNYFRNWKVLSVQEPNKKKLLFRNSFLGFREP